MKQLAVVVIVLVAVAAGMPAVVGTMTENRVMEQAERLSESEAVTVSVRDYERGWRASTATVDLNLSPLYQDRIKQLLIQDQNEPVQVPAIEEMLARPLSLAVELTHGPLMTDDGVHVGLANSTIRLDPQTVGLDELLAELDVPYLFEIRTRSDFSTVSTFETDIPPMVFEDDNGAFSFSGLNAEGSYDIANRHVIADGQIDSIEVESELVTVAAENLSLTGDYQMISTYVWEGLGDLLLERMTILNATPSGPPFLEADNAGVSARLTLNDTRDKLQMDMSYTIESVSGDDLSLTDTRFDLVMSNLDVIALEAYNQLSRRMLFEPNQSVLLLAELEDAFYQLLAAEPAVDIGPLNFVWNGEGFEAVVRIQTDTEMLPSQVAFNLMDSSLWTRLFAVDAEMDVSQNLAERIAIEASKYQLRQSAEASGQEFQPEQLDAIAESQGPGMLLLLVAQGMVQASETGYRTRVTLVNGLLEVNGVPLGQPF